MLLNILIVGVGGFIGSIARYLTYVWVRAAFAINFPLATLLVNVVGCFIIGIIAELVRKAFPVQEHIVLLISTGFLGALTTFSTFGLETMELLREQSYAIALLNIAANLFLGFSAVLLGRYLTNVL